MHISNALSIHLQAMHRASHILHFSQGVIAKLNNGYIGSSRCCAFCRSSNAHARNAFTQLAFAQSINLCAVSIEHFLVGTRSTGIAINDSASIPADYISTSSAQGSNRSNTGATNINIHYIRTNIGSIMGQNMDITHAVLPLINIGITNSSLGLATDFIHISSHTYAHGCYASTTNGAGHSHIIKLMLAISINNNALYLLFCSRNRAVLGHSIILDRDAIATACSSQIAIVYICQGRATNSVYHYCCAHTNTSCASCANTHSATIILQMLLALS